jgi:hypothetical protein
MRGALVRLYPYAWRQRYGAELTGHLANQPLTLSDICDLLAGALDAHLSPQAHIRPFPRTRWTMYAFGLALGTLSAIAVTLTNIVIPLMNRSAAGSDDDIGLLYPLIFLGLLTYFALSGAVVGRRRGGDPRTGAVAGGLTALIFVVMFMATFAIIDNLFIDVVGRQPDKLAGFSHSSFATMRDYVNDGLVRGALIGVPFLAIVGTLCGATGSLIASLPHPSRTVPRPGGG